jgi:hypothetical protein
MHRLLFLLHRQCVERIGYLDYLLFIGDPTAMSIVAVVAAQRNNGRFKCLKWDKRERRYIPIQIDFNNAFKKGESYEFDEYV